MVRRARAKASAHGACFVVGDAAAPGLARASYDVVLCRHVRWALPDPEAVVDRWARLLAPGCRLVLVEGSWSTGAGLTARETARIVRSVRREADVRRLGDAVYWGREITDERYLLVSRA
jgi:SAM-dependent methyltransferase